MRRGLLLIAIAAGCGFIAPFHASATPATSNSQSSPTASEDDQGDNMKWKLINTGIFVLLVGYAVMKYAPKFFNSRSLDIQKAIKEATGLKIDADFRYSEADKKMANLSGEVERMKAEGAAEMEREHQRLQQEEAEEIAHMKRNTALEIEFLQAEGAAQVKRHTAQLAFALAERRLLSHFGQNDGQNGIREFVTLVGSGAAN